MATRQPLWKWHRWKQYVSFYPYTKVMCYLSLGLITLICIAKLKLESTNQNGEYGHKTPIWKWHCTKSVDCSSLDLIFKAKLKLESGNRKIQYGRQVVVLQVTSLKINRFMPAATNINKHIHISINVVRWYTAYSLYSKRMRKTHMQKDILISLIAPSQI